jgi:hypothetical protein
MEIYSIRVLLPLLYHKSDIPYLKVCPAPCTSNSLLPFNQIGFSLIRAIAV